MTPTNPLSPQSSSKKQLQVTSNQIRSQFLPFSPTQLERTKLWDSLQLENNRLRHQIKLLNEKMEMMRQEETESTKMWEIETQTEVNQTDAHIQCSVKHRNRSIQTDPLDLEPKFPHQFKRKQSDTENLILEPNDTILIYACACFKKLREGNDPAKAQEIDQLLAQYLDEIHNMQKKKQMRTNLRIKLRSHICDSFDDFYFLKSVMQKKKNSLEKDKKKKSGQLFDQVIGVTSYETTNKSNPIGRGMQAVQSCLITTPNTKPSPHTPRSKYAGQTPIVPTMFSADILSMREGRQHGRHQDAMGKSLRRPKRVER